MGPEPPPGLPGCPRVRAEEEHSSRKAAAAALAVAVGHMRSAAPHRSAGGGGRAGRGLEPGEGVRDEARSAQNGATQRQPHTGTKPVLLGTLEA